MAFLGILYIIGFFMEYQESLDAYEKGYFHPACLIFQFLAWLVSPITILNIVGKALYNFKSVN